MSDTERLVVGLLVATMILFVPGFLLHEAPRFPGSLAGSLLGIVGAAAMLLLLAYSLVKRVSWLKRWVSLGTMLSFHVYAGVIGALFGILHTGHKYQSPLGIVLVLAMLMVVVSGFAGRYYLIHVGTDIRDQRQRLGVLRTRYDLAAASFANTVPPAVSLLPDAPLHSLIKAIADLEFAIGRREALKRAFSLWVILHIAVAIVFYQLLALHVWSGVYYGLRWLP